MDVVSVFADRYPVFPEAFVKEAVFPPSYVLGTLSKIRWG
jgi:hypothetical protein